MFPSKFIPQKCPFCAKLLFNYREGANGEIAIWCRHCKAVVIVRPGEQNK